MKASYCSNLISLICCQMLIPIHQSTPLLKWSLTLSGHQEEFLMGCLLHLLCESARPNNGMQRTALRAAADAERWTSEIKRLRGLVD